MNQYWLLVQNMPYLAQNGPSKMCQFWHLNLPPLRHSSSLTCCCYTILNLNIVMFFHSQVRVDSAAKIAELELAEKSKMKDKVDLILKHNINCFINRWVFSNNKWVELAC